MDICACTCIGTRWHVHSYRVLLAHMRSAYVYTEYICRHIHTYIQTDIPRHSDTDILYIHACILTYIQIRTYLPTYSHT